MIIMRYLLIGLTCLATVATSADLPTTPPPIAADAESITPIAVGASMPGATLRDENNAAVELATLWAEQPVILITYRGSWCPYCVRQLAGLRDVATELRAAGWQIIAVSPDRPEVLAPPEPDGIVRLSDQDAFLTRALGLAFQVDAATREKYREYGIDLAAASGREHFLLPVPAVILIDTSGTVRFVHADPDYRQRLDPAKVRAAAQTVTPMP